MSKITMILSGLFALSLGFAGCSSEEPFGSIETNPGIPSTPGTGASVSFSAAFNTSPDSEMKKLAYEGGDRANVTTSINWTENDRIRVYSSSSENNVPAEGVYVTDATDIPAAFAYVAEEGSSKITWGDFSSAQQFQAFYPANDAGTTGFPGGKAQFTVPAEQYPTVENGMGMNNVLLYAAASAESRLENISFTFDNVVTVLELTVPPCYDRHNNQIAIEYIEVRARGENADKLAGTFTAKTEGVNPAIGFSDTAFEVEESASTITVYPPENWKSGTLYVALAPYAYDGLTITLVCDNGFRMARIVSKDEVNVVAARKLYPISRNSSIWKRVKADMGLRVVSDIIDGAVMTRVVGYINGTSGANSRAWKVCDDASTFAEYADYRAAMLAGAVPESNILTGSDAVDALEGSSPLYFATGNLHIMRNHFGRPKTSDAFIEPVDITTDVGTEYPGLGQSYYPYGMDTWRSGLFRYGDPTGEMSSTTGTHYPDCHISGNPIYDIARATIGRGVTGVAGWRLPTALEWAFLIEELAKYAKTSGGLYWASTEGYAASGTYQMTPAPWLSSAFKGYIITSKAIDETLYLPAMGYLGNTVYNEGTHGLYRSGSYAGMAYGSPQTRGLYFTDNFWGTHTRSVSDGQSVRPVTE